MKHGSLISPDESSFGFGGPKAAVEATAAASGDAADFITVPDAHLLFSGEFKHSGNDLKIIGDDGKSFLVTDYFKTDKHPTLRSPDGATLDGDLVGLLAGPLNPGQYAQAGAPQPGAAEVVGHVAVVTGNVSVIRNGVAITVNAGDAILKNDVLQTGAGATMGVAFNDGSTFNLSANARLAVNEFVYDPQGSSNASAITLIQGAATFVAGQIAKTGDMKVGTPVATMGIRGTAVILDINALDGRVSISVVDQRDNLQHNVEVFDRAGNLIATATSIGGKLYLTPTATLEVIASFTNKTPDLVAQEFAAFQAVLSSYEAAKQFFPNLPDHTDLNPKNTQHAEGTTIQPSGSGSKTIPDPVTIGDKVVVTEVVIKVASDVPGGDGKTGTDGTPTVTETTFTPLTLNPVSGSGTFSGTEGADDIKGSDDPDTIDALGGNDVVHAYGGDDILIAGHGEGDDYYDGGPNGEFGDTIRFRSTNNAITFDLVSIAGINTADNIDTGHDIFTNIEWIESGGGNDVFYLHGNDDWILDGGAGTDIIRFVGAFDILGGEGGIETFNIEIVDLNQDFANAIRLEAGGVYDSNSQHIVRVMGGGEGATADTVNLTNNFFKDGAPIYGHWALVDTGVTFCDGFSGDATFYEYEFVDENGSWLATAFLQDTIDVNVEPIVELELTPQPVTGEFAVSTTMLSHHNVPAIAALADGKFVAVYMSNPAPGGFDIYAHVLNSDGSPDGEPFLVNATHNLHWEGYPDVVGLTDGSFVVTYWDVDAHAIYGTKVMPSGAQASFTIDADGAPRFTKATALPNGGFAVIWDEGAADIHLAVYDNNLHDTPVETAFAATGLIELLPSIAAIDSTHIVATWYAKGEGASAGFVHGQIIDLNTGEPVGDTFQVNSNGMPVDFEANLATGREEDQFRQSTAAFGNGKFVVTWTSENDGDFDIYAQMFDSHAAWPFKVGDPIKVNAENDNADLRPSVTALSDGGFIVTWHNGPLVRPENEDTITPGDEIFVQRFAANGQKIGAEFAVNETSPGRQYYPVVTETSDGKLAIIWHSSQDGDGGGDAGIYGRIFDLPGITQEDHNIEFSFNVVLAETAHETVLQRVVITGLPAQVSLEVGGRDGNSWVIKRDADDDGASAGFLDSVTNSDGCGTLTLIPDENFNGGFSLNITATILDTVTGAETASDTVVYAPQFLPVNDAPALDLNGEAAGHDRAMTVVDGTTNNFIAADASIVDADADSIASIVITLTNPQDGALEALEMTGQLQAGLSGVFLNDERTQIEFSGNASAAAYEHALSLVRYGNLSENPNETPRIITFEISDGVTTSTSTTTVTIVDHAQDAPVLDDSATPVLTAQNEDSGGPSGSVGTLVSDLVDLNPPSGGLDNVTDDGTVNGFAIGIALTGVATANGSWWYSLNNGQNWSAVNTNEIDEGKALLLPADANARLYFQPNANFSGTIDEAITFRAWDQIEGSVGNYILIEASGGSTSVSAATDTASITITPVNDAPVANEDTLSGDLAGFTYNSANGHWYAINPHEVTWTQARSEALAAGGYLATITTIDENDFISALLTSYVQAHPLEYPFQQTYAYVGGTDQTVDGEWRWIDGPEANLQFWEGATDGFATNGAYENWQHQSDPPFDQIEPGNGSNENYMYVRGTGEWVEYPGTAYPELLSVIEVSFVEDTVSVIPAAFLLANDSDADGPTPSIYSVSETGATHGTVQLVDGNIEYMPDANYNGPVSFEYTVSDGTDVSAPATASFDVAAVNDAPVISIDEAQTLEYGNTTTLSGLSVTDADASENETFHVTAVAEHGGVSLVNQETNDCDDSESGVSFYASYGTVNGILQQGFVYSQPESQDDPNDKVTLTITDQNGASDTLNFVFNNFGTDPITLIGTEGKDVIFATGYTGDTLTGDINGAHSADTFVFDHNVSNEGTGNDTITDFTPGQDRLMLNAYDGVPLASNFTEDDLFAWKQLGGIVQQNNDTLIHLNGNDETILLQNVTAANLTANDFIIHPGGFA